MRIKHKANNGKTQRKPTNITNLLIFYFMTDTSFTPFRLFFSLSTVSGPRDYEVREHVRVPYDNLWSLNQSQSFKKVLNAKKHHQSRTRNSLFGRVKILILYQFHHMDHMLEYNINRRLISINIRHPVMYDNSQVDYLNYKETVTLAIFFWTQPNKGKISTQPGVHA